MFQRMIFIALHLVFFLADYAKAQCCSEGAWGALKNEGYQTLGTVDTVRNLEIYHVGNSSKCIIWNYDWHGFDSGRTRQMVDFFAAHDYTVFLPDYYRGGSGAEAKSEAEAGAFLKAQSDWGGSLGYDWKTVKDYGKKRHGCTSWGTIGTCWGSYPVVRGCEDVDIKAGIAMHPSHPAVMNQVLKEDEKEILKNVKCDMLFMPAGHDAESTKRNGLGKEVLGDGLKVVEFPDMKHGWTIRGDLSDPTVERDVKKAFNLALNFFRAYL